MVTPLLGAVSPERDEYTRGRDCFSAMRMYHPADLDDGGLRRLG